MLLSYIFSFDKDGVLVSQADLSPFLCDNGLWTREDYEEKERLREKKKKKSPW